MRIICWSQCDISSCSLYIRSPPLYVVIYVVTGMDSSYVIACASVWCHMFLFSILFIDFIHSIEHRKWEIIDIIMEGGIFLYSIQYE